MSERSELANQYIKHVQGQRADKLIKFMIGANEPKSLDYYLGAEKITIGTIKQLQQISAPESVMFVWCQILSSISYEIERISAFEGKE